MPFLDDLQIRFLLWCYGTLVHLIYFDVSGAAAIVFTFSLLTAVTLDSERHAFWKRLFLLFMLVSFVVGPGAAAWSPYAVDVLENSGRWRQGVFRNGLQLPLIEWGTGRNVSTILRQRVS